MAHSNNTVKLLSKPALDPASTLILVTGATGYIGANIVKEALDLGYKVRGTSRSQRNADKLQASLGQHPNLSTAIVSTFEHNDSSELKNAMQGVNVVIHVASDLSWGTDYEKIVNGMVDITTNVLEAAAAEPSVERFVYTSSSASALIAQTGVRLNITTDNWNNDAVKLAKEGKKDDADRGLLVYAASKTEAERAVWKFVREKRPKFVVNTVLPNCNFGRVVNVAGATANIPIGIFQKDEKPMVDPQYFVDVVDVARIHLIAAAFDDSLKDQRIFACAEPFNKSRLVDIIQKVRPDVKVKLTKDTNEGEDVSTFPKVGAELLKKWYGQDGYTSLEESIKANLVGIEP